MRMDKPHKKLRAWQVGMEIVEDVYRITRSYPKEELFGLVSQMRRSAVSNPSNIAEGAARQSTKEFINFLYISAGSVSELDTQLELSKRLEYITQTEHHALDQKLEESDRLIFGLIKSQKAKL